MISPISLIFLFLGCISILFFLFDVFFSLQFSLILSLVLYLILIYQFKKNKVGIFMIIMISYYSLPFIHLIPYLWIDFVNIPDRIWGLKTNVPYLFDEEIIKITAMLFLTGLIGILFGSLLSTKRIEFDLGLDFDGFKKTFKCMGMFIWLIWLIIGLLLSIISAPSESLFISNYRESQAFLHGLNFSSAWMMSYIILTYIYVDSLLDNSILRKRLKLFILLFVIIYIFFFLQILRGNRESVPWVLSLIFTHLYWARPFIKNNLNKLKIPIIKSLFIISLILILSFIVATFRHSLSGLKYSEAINLIFNELGSGKFNLNYLLSGTWSAVMLTPLSVAGDYVNNIHTFRYGRDYLDIILSLPPGFIADFFNYDRPLNINRGPAYEMTYGLGGTHSVVLPFRNFGIFGVFIIMSIWSFIFNRFEINTTKNISVISLTFLSIFTFVLPHWLWFGDKFLINAFIILIVLSYFYKISIMIRN